MSGIRILHVFGRMQRGGAEMRTLELMRAIDRTQFQFEFCALSGLPGELDNEIRGLGGEVHYMKLDHRFPWRFPRLLREQPFDVVHSHVYYVSGLMLRLAANAGVGKRIAHFRSCVDSSDSSLRRRIQQSVLAGWINQYATDILAVSEAAMQFAWESRYQRDARCQLIYNGIDLSRFSHLPVRADTRAELAISADVPVFIHVGHLREAKNHERLLRIFAEILVRLPNAQLLLVGGGTVERQRKLETCAKTLAIGEHVHMLGTRDDVPRLLHAADAMIFPSLWEGLPGAVLEACAAGLPVLASDLPMIPEMQQQLPMIQSLPLSAADDKWAETARSLVSNHSESHRQEWIKSFKQTDFSHDVCMRIMCQIWTSTLSPGLAA